MKIFNHKDPAHLRILKEELNRAKRLIREAYSADEIWNKMSLDDRKTSLYVAKTPNPNKLISVTWDNIPADVQDLIDLSDYELATSDQGGRSMLRGINYALKENPIGQSFVKQYLQRIHRASLNDITIKQSYELNIELWRYIADKAQQAKPKTPTQPETPKDPMSGATIPSRNPFYKGGSSWTGD